MAEPRRSLWLVVALLVVAAAALWTASLLVWTWQVDVAGGVPVARSERGAQAQPLLVGLALAALAAVAAVLATGGWPRRAVGALVAVGGVGALVLAARGLAEPRTREAGERWAAELGRWSVQATTGVVLTALAGLLLLAGGVVVVVAGQRMPRMGARYQRRPAPDAGRTMWDELDAGGDPTDR
jgi:uncharacterized membrane protein (TIGR02234 family)